jgi:hypothetical protein
MNPGTLTTRPDRQHIAVADGAYGDETLSTAGVLPEQGHAVLAKAHVLGDDCSTLDESLRNQ